GECRFVLESVGRFALESCVSDEDGNSACFRTFLGKNQTDWEESPWDDFIQAKLKRVGKGDVEVGDVVEYEMENIYKNARALVLWGSGLGVQRKVVELPDDQLANFNITIEDTCAAGCSLLVHVNVPRQAEGEANALGVPTTPFFDPAMPQTMTLREDIDVRQDRSVSIQLEFPDLEAPDGGPPVMEPQGVTPIALSVPPCEEGGGGDAACADLADDEEVQYTVAVVDKAVLELVPYELKDMALDFAFDLALRFEVTSSSAYLHAPGAIASVIERFVKEQEADPWALIESELHLPGYKPFPSDDRGAVALIGKSQGGGASASASSSAGASDDADTFAASSAVVFSPVEEPEESPLADEAFDPPTEETAETGATVRNQGDFASTPLFVTVGSAKGGSSTVDFTAPDNLGTFVVRAYAGTDKARFGSAESEIIVRRALSMTPSAPRIVRVGDVFDAGVIITLSGGTAAEEPVSVSLTVEGGEEAVLAAVGETQKSVVVDGDGQVEVRFKLEALALGEGAFNITADDGKGASDALRLTVPVLGLQDAVTVATSFAIQASEGEAAQATEGLDLPAALPGTGGLELLAGVGRLPAVLANARQIMEANA
ncbi:unnamed protein product, partial [Ostreobium quekettii]